MVGGWFGVWGKGGGCEVGRKGVHASVASLADLAGAELAERRHQIS